MNGAFLHEDGHVLAEQVPSGDAEDDALSADAEEAPDGHADDGSLIVEGNNEGHWEARV